MMSRFEHLPIELLPLIVAHLQSPEHLASLCLVSRTFYQFSVPILYKRIAIFPWHRFSKFRVAQLFTTLAECPNLARFVHHLEIRDFPKHYSHGVSDGPPMDLYPKGLKNCMQLRVCAWTRDGSLTSAILKSLGRCPELSDITINGESASHYHPIDLVQLRLRKISLIMPSTPVLEILPGWLQATGPSLTSLALICKEDIHVTDSLLESVSQHLSQLDHLQLAGCPRVTDKGIWLVIRNNLRIMKELSLEGLSPAFDMLALGEACTKAGSLTSLRSFTLTTRPQNSTKSWMNGTELLLSGSSLEVLQIYMPDLAVALSDQFFIGVIDQHRDHLVRFSFHRSCISLDVIEQLCVGCPMLEELFVVIHHNKMAHFLPLLARAAHLHTVHIQIVDRPPGPRASDFEHASDILHHCGRTISQVGVATKVWKVERRVLMMEGVAKLERVLTEVENPDIPERFLVVHTS